MGDPITTSVLSSVASKIVSTVWERGEQWLRDKFGSHSQEVQQQAQDNAANFIKLLAERVEVLESQRILDSQAFADVARQPQFSSVLQRALLNAAEVDDSTKLDLLAQLVATPFGVACGQYSFSCRASGV